MTIVNHDNDFIPHAVEKDLIPATADLSPVESIPEPSSPQSFEIISTHTSSSHPEPIKSNEKTTAQESGILSSMKNALGKKK